MISLRALFTTSDAASRSAWFGSKATKMCRKCTLSVLVGSWSRFSSKNSWISRSRTCNRGTILPITSFSAFRFRSDCSRNATSVIPSLFNCFLNSSSVSILYLFLKSWMYCSISTSLTVTFSVNAASKRSICLISRSSNSDLCRSASLRASRSLKR